MLHKAKLAIPLALFTSTLVHAENMDINDFLQDVIDHYPAIKTAYFQVAQAQLDNVKIRGQLGWQLGAETGYAKEVSLFGAPVDQLSVAGSLKRKLLSGDSLSFSGALSYEDAESTLPGLPNPATSTELKVEYTKPFGQGAGNIDYTLSLNNAKAGLDIKVAEQRILLDKMAEQVIDLYLSALTTKQRINNTNTSIKRTIKLSKFINSRLNLGIVEEKDQLQTDAQLQNQKAQLSSLKLAWTQQTIAINRLTGNNWDTQFLLSTPSLTPDKLEPFKQQIELINKTSPDLLKINSRITMSENKILLERQSQQDKLDLKFYIGNKTSSGDATPANVSESDIVAGIKLSFSQSIDKTAENAALFQAQLDRGLLLQNKKQILEDIRYDLASLLAESIAVRNSIEAYKNSQLAETKQLHDAEKRYKSGRIDIDQLLQFENQLSSTELTLSLQKMELQKRLLKLSLLKGEIWKNIKLPEYDFSIYESNSDEKLSGESL